MKKLERKRRMKKRHSYSKWLLCLSVFFLINSSAFALNFQIDKGKVFINLPPGWSDGGKITIENKDSEPLNVRAYISDWEYSDADGSKVFIAANTGKRSSANWIKFYPADFSVPALGKKEVNFVVNVPNDAVGGHYAVLFFEVQTGMAWDEASGSYVKVYNRLGTLFYVEPQGTAKKEARIENFSIEELAGVIKLGINLINTGNVQIIAKGSFDIIDSDGIVFARGSFGEVYSMPDDTLVLSASNVGLGFSKGTYDVVVTFDLDGASVAGEWHIVVDDQGKITKITQSE